MAIADAEVSDGTRRLDGIGAHQEHWAIFVRLVCPSPFRAKHPLATLTMNETFSHSDQLLRSETLLRPVARLLEPTWVRITVVSVYTSMLFCLTHANLKGTLLDQAEYPDHFSMLDKVFHFGSYAVLTYLLLSLFGGRRSFVRDRSWQHSFGSLALSYAILWSLLIFCYGAMDELTQPYFGRRCDIFDWIADVVGVLMANAVYFRRDIISSLFISFCSAKERLPNGAGFADRVGNQ